MPGGRNKSIGPVQVSMSGCVPTVPFAFCPLSLGTRLAGGGLGGDSGSAWDGAGLRLTEPSSAFCWRSRAWTPHKR